MKEHIGEWHALIIDDVDGAIEHDVEHALECPVDPEEIHYRRYVCDVGLLLEFYGFDRQEIQDITKPGAYRMRLHSWPGDYWTDPDDELEIEEIVPTNSGI